MSTGEAQDRQRRGHHLRHDLARLRELQRGPAHLPGPLPRGMLPFAIPSRPVVGKHRPCTALESQSD